MGGWRFHSFFDYTRQSTRVGDRGALLQAMAEGGSRDASKAVSDDSHRLMVFQAHLPHQ
jgi:hypothetical protein